MGTGNKSNRRHQPCHNSFDGTAPSGNGRFVYFTSFLPRHALIAASVLSTLCGWSPTWFRSSRKYFGFYRAKCARVPLSSLRGIVSMAQSHTIIYLQQLYRLFITGWQFADPSRRNSLALSTVTFALADERSCPAQAHACRRRKFLRFPATAQLPVELHFPISLRHSAVTVHIGSVPCRRSVVQCALSIAYASPNSCVSQIQKNKSRWRTEISLKPNRVVLHLIFVVHFETHRTEKQQMQHNDW